MQNFKFFQILKLQRLFILLSWYPGCVAEAFHARFPVSVKKKKKKKKKMTRFAASVFGRRSKMSEDYVK